MTDLIKGFLLDPFCLDVEGLHDDPETLSTIAENVLVDVLHVPGDLNEIYAALTPAGAERPVTTFEAVQLPDGRHTLWVDEEGMSHGKPKAWISLRGYPSPLAGRGLIQGFDPDTGDSISATMSAETVMRNVKLGFGNTELFWRDGQMEVLSWNHPIHIVWEVRDRTHASFWP